MTPTATPPPVTAAEARERIRQWWLETTTVIERIRMTSYALLHELQRDGSPIAGIINLESLKDWAGGLQDAAADLMGAMPETDIVFLDPLKNLPPDVQEPAPAADEDDEEPAEPDATPLDTPSAAPAEKGDDDEGREMTPAMQKEADEAYRTMVDAVRMWFLIEHPNEHFISIEATNPMGIGYPKAHFTTLGEETHRYLQGDRRAAGGKP